MIAVQLQSNHMCQLSFSKKRDHFSKNKEGFSARAIAHLNISWLLIDMHKYHITVVSSTPAAAFQKSKSSGIDSKRKRDFDNNSVLFLNTFIL